MPAAHPSVQTVDEYFGLPENRSVHDELLDGLYILTPQPTVIHERVVAALVHRLWPALASRSDLEVFGSRGAVVLGPGTVVEPDLFVVPRVTSPATHWRDLEKPILVAEILSPLTARRDRGIKRHIYQRGRIPEYWIVDPDARLIERWRPADDRPEILTDAITWQAPGSDTSIEIQLADFFSEVLDR
jgi:Uma2 family endonuclease